MNPSPSLLLNSLSLPAAVLNRNGAALFIRHHPIAGHQAFCVHMRIPRVQGAYPVAGSEEIADRALHRAVALEVDGKKGACPGSISPFRGVTCLSSGISTSLCYNCFCTEASKARFLSDCLGE